jgi:hypothetical protein
MGLSTRRYPVGLEPVGAPTEHAATSTAKSAVSRRLVAATRPRWLSSARRGPVGAGPGRADASEVRLPAGGEVSESAGVVDDDAVGVPAELAALAGGRRLLS